MFGSNRLALPPPHWSKDYVEHLRTVHFTLIVASVSLIVIVTSGKPYNPSVAVREIKQILQLKRSWSPDWIRENGDANIIKRDLGEYKHELRNQVFVDPSDVFLPDDNFPLSLGAPFHGMLSGNNRGNSKQVLRFLWPRENWLMWQPHVHEWPTKFPNTLEEFSQWWDALSKPHEMYFPWSVSDIVSVTRSVVGDQSAKLSFDQSLDKYGDQNEMTPQVPLHLTLDPRGKEEEIGAIFEAQDRELSFLFRISDVAHITVTQKTLARRFGWQPASFSDSFRDLAQAAKEFHSLDLEEVKQILADDASKGSEVFEAYGIKFPAAELTLAGSLVILFTQIYLLTYLKRLHARIDSDGQAMEIPWIGMDQAVLARFLFFITLVLLPVTATLLLGKSELVIQMRPLRTGDRGAFVQLGGTLFVSIVVAALSWWHRPRVDDIRCPPELFE